MQKLLQSDREGLDLMTIISNSTCSNWEALDFENKQHKLINKLESLLLHTEVYFCIQARRTKLMAVPVYLLFFFPSDAFFFPQELIA